MKRGWILGIVSIIFLTVLGNTCHAAEPPSSLEVTVPDYVVTTMGGLDYVEIPGGEVLLAEEGRPRVPYYTKSIDYPEGYKVQDVILEERSGLETATGLRLPVVILSPSPELPIEMKEGWYPEKDYEWRVWDNPDGSTTLVIMMYPFYYDPATTSVEFYRYYRFKIEYIVSSVAITGLAPAEEFYQPGDKVSIDIQLHNFGTARDVLVEAVIRQYGSDEILSGLPLRLLKNLAGDASLTVDWETTGVEAGYYYAEVTLTDTSGNILDRERVGFPLEVYEGLEKPKGLSKFPIIYLIIGAVVILGAVASVLAIRLMKKATSPRKKI